MECYCDYEQPTVYRKAVHTARKEHRCYECRRTIQPGERYESVFAVWEGKGQVAPTCQHCLDLRDFVLAHVPCSCWTHGNMREDVLNDAYAWSHEAPGLLFGAYRREIAIRRARKDAEARG